MDDDVNRLGLIDDEDIVLDEAALALARLDQPEVDLDAYDRVLDAITAGLERIGEDREDAAETLPGRAAQLQGLTAEDRSHGVGGRAEVPVDEGRGRAPSSQDQAHDLERLREPETVPFQQTEAARAVALQILGEVTAGLLEAPDLRDHHFTVVAAGLAEAAHQGGGAIARVPAGMQQ